MPSPGLYKNEDNTFQSVFFFFFSVTGQTSIKELLFQVIQTPNQQAYVRKLFGYNFCIEYKHGCYNLAINVLSRVNEEFDLNSSSSCMLLSSKPISESLDTLLAKKTSLLDLLHFHKNIWDASRSSNYFVNDGLLLFWQCYYINLQYSLKINLLHEFHATSTMVTQQSIALWFAFRQFFSPSI